MKQIIHNCVICQRYQCRPYKGPSLNPLPLMLVEERPPFSNTGVDFAGPMYARESLASNTRKLWICLFTRAVHINLVSEMDIASFLHCFKRFTARCGIPFKTLSDNTKTFKGAEKWIVAGA